jgi:hypothetical protein
VTIAMTGIGWNEPMPSAGLGVFSTVSYAAPAYDCASSGTAS